MASSSFNAFGAQCVSTTKAWLEAYCAPADASSARALEYPSVTLTWAQSLDGCLALAKGKQTAISGSESLAITHALRSMHSAILVGINTLSIDNPRLNVRCVEGKNPDPIVLDTRLRIPHDCKLLTDATCARPVVYCSCTAFEEASATDKIKAIQAAGGRVQAVEVDASGHVSLLAVLRHLKATGYGSIMIEGGPTILKNAFRALAGVPRLRCRIIVTVSPQFLFGDVTLAGTGVAIPPVRMSSTAQERVGEDTIIHGYWDVG